MQLSIDSVGSPSSVAVSDGGRVLAEITWHTGRRHTPSLVPQIDAVCRLAAIEREQLQAVFVDIGPGAYGGIRAGMAAADAIAVALDLQLVGANRLEIEAYAHAAARGPIVPVHRAGRGQWASAVYSAKDGGLREDAAPALSTLRQLVETLRETPEPGVLCGELELLEDDVRAFLSDVGWTLPGAAASMRRAGLLAELGWRALQAGRAVDPGQLEPLYLREPAIGPQAPVEEDVPVIPRRD